ncbi:MAG: tetratricopeptide repeat protein [Bacteroidetes bacterium]|nr:tetratricopeptide repeat protein [Bacteroidota bacterium]
MITNPTYLVKFLLLGILIVISNAIQANSEKDSLLTVFKSADHDTVRIMALFGLGNLYIDGPSDSLLHYYDRALKITRANLDRLEKERIFAGPEFDAYKNFEVRAVIEFGIEYFFRSDYDKALQYYFEALKIARQIGDPGLLSECLSEIGIVYKNQGRFELALDYYARSLAYAEQTMDTSWIASSKVNLGNVYKEQGYLTLALKYYLEALSTLEPLGHDRRIAACYQNIGDIYHKQHDFNKALEYYSRALSLAKNSNDLVRETTCYMNIGYVYAGLNAFQEARNFYDKALDLFDKSGYSHEKDDCFILIGDTYMGEDDAKTAAGYYQKALELSQSEGDLSRQSESLIKLGQIRAKEKQYSEGIKLTHNGLQMAKQVGALDLQVEAYKTLSDVYDHQGQFDQSLKQFRIYADLKDSLFSVEKYRTIAEMEMKYETEKKEAQLALLEEQSEVQELRLSRRNRMMYTTGAVAALLLVIGYISFRNYRLRSRQKAITLEQQLMRSQMNPHFIFNSLIAIQSYIYKQDPVKAGDFLAKFADLVRITLENSRVEFVLLEKELRMLNAYLELQSLRYDGKFDFSIKLDETIDPAETLIPPMMAQPFIENAIEHGLRHKKERGSLKIEFAANGQSIKCTISDDGVGREKAKEMEAKKGHQSMATGITRERLANFSKKFRQKFILQIEDLISQTGDAGGTLVVLELPIKSIN